MAMAERADLVTRLSLDDKFSGPLKKAGASLHQLSVKSVAAGTAIGVGLERAAERGIGFLLGQVRSGEAALVQLQTVTAQTGAVIASTGSAAGVTAAQVRALAQAQEDLTTVDDKVVQSGENMLLTFTGIGADVFPRATKAMVDMAIAMNGGNTEGLDLTKTAIQLGKALNDPVKGATALQRVGVRLTDQQKKQIGTLLSLTKSEQAHYLTLRRTDKAAAERYKAAQIASRLGKAQAVILKELETEFGKSGEAAGKSGAAGIKRLSDAVEDAQIALAQGLAPALDDIRRQITTALKDPATLAAIQGLGKWLGEAAQGGIAFAKSIPWGQVADGLKTAAGFAGGLVKVFTSMPPEFQATILALAGLNKLTGGAVGGLVGELGKGLIKGVLGMTAGVVNINAGVVNGGGLGGPGGVAPVGGLAGLLSGGLLAISLAAIVPAVLVSLTEAILGGTEGILKKDIAGRTETNIARGGSGAVPTGPLRGGGPGAMNPTQWVSPVQRSLDTVRRATELSRIGVTTAIRAEQSALMSRSIGEQTAIVAAIRGIQRPIVSVSVVGNRVTTTYATGTTLSRNINPNVLALT